MSTVVKDLGAVSAYAYAVEKGYTGTEAEFAELMASYAEVGQTAADAAESALNSKTAAQTAATTATNKASEATTAAQTATTKAREASQSASDANTAKDEAVTAKTAAETAQGKAEDAQAAAERVAESIPSDYSQLSDDVSDLKEGLTTVTVDGYNLIKIAEHGVGAYYASGSKLTFNASYTTYHYAIMPVEPNSRYYVSNNPRWWVLTDDNDTILSSGTGFNPTTKKFIETGNATKFYYTIDSNSWNSEATYGRQFAIIVTKSNNGSGSLDNVSKPEWLSGLSQRMCDSRYAFAFPRIKALFTLNAVKKYYLKNLLALDSNYVTITVDSRFVHERTKEYLALKFTSTGENSIWANIYDNNLSLVEQQSKISAIVKSDNLSNCSALVIGDSTVAQNTMTQKMLDTFTAKDKTLTLLGTMGTAPNLHEGRSGWSANQYCTQSENNPFYNNGFDFSHYMTAQGYSEVDFVVLQIGINDLYNSSMVASDDKIAETMGYVCTMIESILAWNSSQKIIVNLLTPVNPNYDGYPMYFKRNIFVRYNARMILELTKYAYANVRPSDTFAILDPEADISDNVHPNATGYEKMALEVVNQINCWQNG